MKTTPATWQKRFGLSTCAASEVEKSIPASALGVAVIYATEPAGEKIFLIIESRAGSLRSQCLRRLETAKLPAVGALTVSFVAEILGDPTPESVHEACRKQVLLAAEMRRELRPTMR